MVYCIRHTNIEDFRWLPNFRTKKYNILLHFFEEYQISILKQPPPHQAFTRKGYLCALKIKMNFALFYHISPRQTLNFSKKMQKPTTQMSKLKRSGFSLIT